SIPLSQVARFRLLEGPNQISRENGKRRVVVTANARGRDIASGVADAQASIKERVSLPPGYWLTWGGQFENLAAARQRLMVVVPGCFALIFLLLLGALGSARDALLVLARCRWRSSAERSRCGCAACRSPCRRRWGSSPSPVSPFSMAW